MTKSYTPMNNGHFTGVVERDIWPPRWVVEPEFTWRAAEAMSQALNQNPEIEPDELYKIGRAA